MKQLRVFTDGACHSNGKASAKAGCGVYFGDTKQEFSLDLAQAKKICNINEKINNTNNTGEMLAILCALNLIKEKTQDVIIYTDSMYCINCISVWNKNWIKNNWKTSTGKNVKNRSLIEAIENKKTEFNSVIFIHVNSHRHEPDDKNSDEYFKWFGNDKADKLATLCLG